MIEVEARIKAFPSWARPPFYGLFFVYMLIASRAIIAVPIAIILVLMNGPEGILKGVWVLIIAGLAGFGGGVAFSIARLSLRWAGKAGDMVTGWVTVFAYLLVLLPGVSSEDPRSRQYFSLNDHAAWFSLILCSLIFGSIIGTAIASRSAKGLVESD